MYSNIPVQIRLSYSQEYSSLWSLERDRGVRPFSSNLLCHFSTGRQVDGWFWTTWSHNPKIRDLKTIYLEFGVSDVIRHYHRGRLIMLVYPTDLSSILDSLCGRNGDSLPHWRRRVRNVVEGAGRRPSFVTGLPRVINPTSTIQKGEYFVVIIPMIRIFHWYFSFVQLSLLFICYCNRKNFVY